MLGIRRVDAELSESPDAPLVVESSRPRCGGSFVLVGGAPAAARGALSRSIPASGYPLDGRDPWLPQGPALVTLLAPPSAWVAAWPSIPDVHAVQLIPLDSEGRPRMNNGAKLPKRTLGASGGCCTVVGNPAPNADGLIVVEGLADGLALAARREQTLMVTCTTPRAVGPVLDYAATWAAVQLHGDKDGPGQVAAAKLKGALLARGVSVESLIFDGFEDAAAYAEAGNEPLADLSGTYDDDVAAMSADWQAEGLPKHEAQRRAALCCIAPDAPRTPPVERPRQPAPTGYPCNGRKSRTGAAWGRATRRAGRYAHPLTLGRGRIAMNEHPVSYPESDALGAALGAYRSNPTQEAWPAVKDAIGSDSDSDGLDAVDALILELAAAHVGDDNDAKAAVVARLPQSRKDALEQLDAARPLEVLKPGIVVCRESGNADII